MTTVAARFLAPPSTAAAWVADAVRVLIVLSIAALVIQRDLVSVAVFALALGCMVLCRAIGVRSTLDVALGATLLVASWSSTLELYITVPGWDLVVHLFLNGLVAALAVILVCRWTEIGRLTLSTATTALLATAFGVTAGVLWEFGEWVGHTFIDDAIYVGYADTLSDLAAGALGSIIAGGSMRWLADH